jgi:hypothetical protein
LANEVAGLREENARLVKECNRLTTANNHDHTQLLEQSPKVTKELEEVIKDCDACSVKTLELEKVRDLWKGQCNQIVPGIMPVLDLINLELPATEARAQPLGVLDKCQRALGWLQQFVKEAGEYAGTHVHSMVCAHYPLIDFKCLELGYPKEVGPKQADELQI